VCDSFDALEEYLLEDGAARDLEFEDVTWAGVWHLIAELGREFPEVSVGSTSLDTEAVQTTDPRADRVCRGGTWCFCTAVVRGRRRIRDAATALRFDRWRVGACGRALLFSAAPTCPTGVGFVVPNLGATAAVLAGSVSGLRPGESLAKALVVPG
jgi:hypothetical protein